MVDIVERQLLGGILDRVGSRVDRILDRPRTTTTTPQQAPPPRPTTTRAQNPPPQQEAPPPADPAPTTTPPRQQPQPQPTTPRQEAPPVQTPDNTPQPAPVPAPAPSPPPERGQQPAPEPVPERESDPPAPPQSTAHPPEEEVRPQPEPSRQPGEAIQTDPHPQQPLPSSHISRPPQEEVHQTQPADGDFGPSPSGGENAPLPEITSGAGATTTAIGGGPQSTGSEFDLPNFDTDRGNSPGDGNGGGGGGGSKGLDLTQSLALGFGLALFVIIVVGLFFFIRRCRRKRRQRDDPFGHFGASPSKPNMAEAQGAPPPQAPFSGPPHDPEAGLPRHPHGNQQQQFHNTSDQSAFIATLPSSALDYPRHKGSQFDRQASTAAWAQHLPPPPPEPEEEGTGIIKIFRWPTMSSRSVRTTASGPSRSPSGKDTSSRASRSTLSTMLWRSRKSISKRKTRETFDGETEKAEDEVPMVPDIEPRAPSTDPNLMPPPLHIAHALRVPTVKSSERRDLRRELSKGRLQKRDSTLSLSSVGGRSIASSSVLSPTLMSFPAPPMSLSDSSYSAFAMGDRESLPPLPATVYQPYRPGK